MKPEHVARIRAFYEKHSDTPHPDMDNIDISFLSDEEVYNMFMNLCQALDGFMLALNRMDADQKKAYFIADSWLHDTVKLHDELVEEMLFGTDE